MMQHVAIQRMWTLAKYQIRLRHKYKVYMLCQGYNSFVFFFSSS